MALEVGAVRQQRFENEAYARGKRPPADDSRWWKMAGLFVLSLSLRLIYIALPAVIVSEEHRYAEAISAYIRGEYFFDNEPPLGKLLYAAIAWMAGYNGGGKLAKAGMPYAASFPYVALRSTSAIIGALVAPTCFATLCALGVGEVVAALVAAALALDNALLTASRLIIPQSLFLALLALSLLFWSKHRQSNSFASLAATGLLLGLSAGVNWTAVFPAAFMLAYTTADAWQQFCSLVPIRRLVRQAVRSYVCLLVLPLAVYSAAFAAHFATFRSASEAAMWGVTPEYRQALPGISYDSTYADVVHGSAVTLRQRRFDGPYLHSHPYGWPDGSKQQQVTGYGHQDANNVWIFRPSFSGAPIVDGSPVHHGMVVRLQHRMTGRYLHSHASITAPISSKEHHNEVSCYGSEREGFSDHNDNWLIQLVDAKGHPLPVNANGPPQPIRALEPFRLWHPYARCALTSVSRRLPAYGFGQFEITCGMDTVKRNSIWMVETNEHESVRGTSPLVSYRRASFLERLLELNRKMRDAVDYGVHTVATNPLEWPLLDYPPRLLASPEYRLYLVGNPVLWASSIAAVGLFLLCTLVHKVHALHSGDARDSSFFHFASTSGQFVVLWAATYLPHFAAASQNLLLHSYFPALYASAILLAFLLDALAKRTSATVRCAVLALLGAAILLAFARLAPLSYGLALTRSACEGMRLRSTWSLDCSRLSTP